MQKLNITGAVGAALLTLAFAAPASQALAAGKPAAAMKAADISDAALVKSLPGFKNATAEVNGVHLHYVVGGQGEPLVLLPGWPETWWSFHKMMPELAKHYTVIVVDIRGMGASDKPAYGYDKKTLAGDIYQLVKTLGYERVNIAGHDIGSAVAYSFGANYPQATNKVVMLELPHPDESLLTFPLLPAHNTFTDKLDFAHPYLWWFAFNQVQGLPEQLLAGHARVQQDWLFKYFLKDEGALDARDRAVYEKAYNTADAIRASNGWYQTLTQDIIDNKGYAKLEMPILAMGAPAYRWMSKVIPPKGTHVKVVNVEQSGHFIHEERPDFIAQSMIEFLQGDTQ